ncbi:MAG: complex I subunit 1 family protein, partial [Anaerolineae bacterium]
GALTAALYVPLGGVNPAFSFEGDLIVTITLLGLLTLMTGLAGSLSADRCALVGANRTLTQLFSYEVPFLLALLGPALAAGSWQLQEILASHGGRWLLIMQPIGFVVAILGLLGKLELHPFDAPEANTEIVAGALTEYSGRGLALFYLSRGIELVIGLTLVSALYLGGIGSPLAFLAKTLGLLLGITLIEALMTRLRIDQTVSLWWRLMSVAVLVQLLIVVIVGRI